MKVAFASKNGEQIDDHFGWTEKFYVYDITEEGCHFDGEREVVTLEGENDENDDRDRIDARIKAISDCVIIYCAEIGPGAAARVTRSLIHPIKNSDGKIADELVKLQNIMKNPPIWLKKAALNREKKTMAQNLHIDN